MCFLGYIAVGNRVGVRLDGKELSSGLILDRNGAILVDSCVSHGGMGCRTHELVPGQPVMLPQIYESKQDEVVQNRDFVITFTYVSIEVNNSQAYTATINTLALEEGFVQASHLPNGQVMISQPRKLGKQVLSVR